VPSTKSGHIVGLDRGSKPKELARNMWRQIGQDVALLRIVARQCGQLRDYPRSLRGRFSSPGPVFVIIVGVTIDEFRDIGRVPTKLHVAAHARPGGHREGTCF
jgi:hypothetical protein